MGEQLIGTVSHYFGKPGVAAIKVTSGELHVGDTIHVIGHTSDFSQTVSEMQVDHRDVAEARAGDEVGVKVVDRARIHDRVYRVD